VRRALAAACVLLAAAGLGARLWLGPGGAYRVGPFRFYGPAGLQLEDDLWGDERWRLDVREIREPAAQEYWKRSLEASTERAWISGREARVRRTGWMPPVAGYPGAAGFLTTFWLPAENAWIDIDRIEVDPFAYDISGNLRLRWWTRTIERSLRYVPGPGD
jgi:hypothetical protein